MRILLFGREGQLGKELHLALSSLGQLTSLDQSDCDFRHVGQITKIIKDIRPDFIVNAAAYTDVDRAELDHDSARVINGTAPGVIAAESKRFDAVMIHYSSDYVFDGEKRSSYTEIDVPKPINVYGETKLAGEMAIQDANGIFFIFRTSWLYSMTSLSFPTKVMKWAREENDLRIVDDQIGSPTWAPMLAEITVKFLLGIHSRSLNWLHERRGVYHLAGHGSVSRFNWAKQILELDHGSHEHRYKSMIPVPSSEFSTLAKRPLCTSLDCGKFIHEFGIPIPPWSDSLAMAMENC